MFVALQPDCKFFVGRDSFFFLFSGNLKICTEYTEDTQEILLLLKTLDSTSKSFMLGVIKKPSHSSSIDIFKL